MIYHVSGILEHTEPYLAVIDVQGVGYACTVPLTSLSRFSKGDKIKLYTHMYLREDICALYGFATLEELQAFRMLISVSGVGPKAAVSILSFATPERLALAIVTGDEKALTVAPGVGKKLALRVILELKDKLAKSQGSSSPATGSVIFDAQTGPGKLGEAQAALGVLGYSPSDAAMALKELDLEALELEDIIRQALKKLARF